MTVPDEAIEAAAKAEYEHEWSALDGTWDATTKEARALFRQSAKVALEAAAPYLRAQALEDLAKQLEWVKPDSSPCGDTEACCGSAESCDAMRPSVFVIGPASLRARAAAERGPDV